MPVCSDTFCKASAPRSRVSCKLLLFKPARLFTKLCGMATASRASVTYITTVASRSARGCGLCCLTGSSIAAPLELEIDKRRYPRGGSDRNQENHRERHQHLHRQRRRVVA